MGRFVPFREFREQLEADRPGDEATAESRPGRPVEVVHSYLDDDGRWIDCIRTASQPGLAPAEAVAAAPRLIAASGDAAGTEHAAEGGRRRDRLGNEISCPPGCIPVLRADPDRPGSTGSGARFHEKAPGGGALPPRP